MSDFRDFKDFRTDLRDSRDFRDFNEIVFKRFWGGFQGIQVGFHGFQACF